MSDAQIELRIHRRLESARRTSRLPHLKTLADFDFSLQPSVERSQLESLHEPGFLRRHENVVFCGPPGVGKTHLATSLGGGGDHRGAQRVLHDAAGGGRVAAPGAGERHFQASIGSAAARGDADRGRDRLSAAVGGRGRLFFQLVRARHERGTMVLTTNKGFEEWGAVLGDEVMATAMLDRLLHRCHVVNIQGASYRMREYQAMRRAANPISRDDAEPTFDLPGKASSEVDKSGTF